MALHPVSEGSSWTTFTPSLTASTTNPTLGTGGTITGQYGLLPGLVVARVSILFGSSGAAAGSGTYRVSIPVPADSSQPAWMGSGFSFDGTNGRCLVCELDPANSWVQMWTDAATARVAHNVPHAWSNNHQLHVEFGYRPR